MGQKSIIISGGILAFLTGLVVTLAMIIPNNFRPDPIKDCEHLPLGHTHKICHALYQNMEWQWLGHATIAPGWKVTPAGLGRTYCALNLSIHDRSALQITGSTSTDPRISDGTSSLILLVESEDGRSKEPVNSIYNPANDLYILKNGCR